MIWKFIYLYSFIFGPNREVLLWSSRRAAAGRGRQGHGEAQWQKMTQLVENASIRAEYQLRRGEEEAWEEDLGIDTIPVTLHQGRLNFLWSRHVKVHIYLHAFGHVNNSSNKRSPDRPYVAPTSKIFQSFKDEAHSELWLKGQKGRVTSNWIQYNEALAMRNRDKKVLGRPDCDYHGPLLWKWIGLKCGLFQGRHVKRQSLFEGWVHGRFKC